jgi:hypothetical protein
MLKFDTLLLCRNLNKKKFFGYPLTQLIISILLINATKKCPSIGKTLTGYSLMITALRSHYRSDLIPVHDHPLTLAVFTDLSHLNKLSLVVQICHLLTRMLYLLIEHIFLFVLILNNQIDLCIKTNTNSKKTFNRPPPQQTFLISNSAFFNAIRFVFNCFRFFQETKTNPSIKSNDYHQLITHPSGRHFLITTH